MKDVAPCAYDTVHWLPCSIKYDGKAQVEKFFHPAPDSEANPQLLQATFRGRQLRGTRLQLPAGYEGCVLQTLEGKPTVKEGGFRSLTYWNHDMQPSRTDLNSRAMEWLRLAPEMHKPVSVEDVERELEAIMSTPHSS